MASANAKLMNSLIAGARSRSGVVGRLEAAGDLDADRRTELSEALAAAERAIKHGDDIAREIAESKIDRLFDDARAARQEAERAARPPAPSFDGGVRRPATRSQPPNMNRVIVGAIAERRALAAAARGD